MRSPWRCVLLAGVSGVFGCGQAERHEDKRTGRDVPKLGLTGETAFADWCAAWQLDCPAGAPENVPSPDRPWTLDQWRHLMATVKALGDGASRVTLTRAELDDANLRTVAERLHLDAALDTAKARLDEAAMSSLAIEHGALAMTTSEPRRYATTSGLVVASATTVGLHVGDDLGIALTGLSFASGGGDLEAPVDTLAFSGTNVMTWSGADHVVTGAPIKFLLEQTLGTSLGGDTAAAPGYADLVPALVPLRDWLTSGLRDIDVTSSAFTQLSTHVPPLASDPAMATTLRNVLRRLTRLQSTAASRPTKLIQASASSAIQCHADAGTITLQSSFGVQSMTRLGNGAVSLTLYGIDVKPSTGVFRPTIHLSRVDLTPTTLTVQNVPVIGSYTVDMTQPSSGLACD